MEEDEGYYFVPAKRWEKWLGMRVAGLGTAPHGGHEATEQEQEPSDPDAVRQWEQWLGMRVAGLGSGSRNAPPALDASEAPDPVEAKQFE